ncbi:MAG: lipopolysaccharide biosynthesis protein [Parvibaculaceae bacterium]
MELIMKLAPQPLRGLAEQMLKGQSHGARSGRGAISAFLVRVASAALMFVSQVAFARWLGAHDYGVFTFVLVLVNVIGTLCPAGFATSVVRFMPEYRERSETGLARGFLLSGGIVSFSVGILAAVAALAVLLGYDGLVSEDYRIPIAVGLLSLPAFALTDYMDGVGRSQGWINLALTPPYIVRPCLILLFVGLALVAGFTNTAATAAMAATVAIWVTMLAQFLVLSRRFNGELPQTPRRYDTKTWFWVSVPLVILEGFSILLLNVDVLLLERFVSPDQVGIYFAAARTISLIAFIHFAASAAVTPRFSALYARGDIDGLKTLVREARKWTFLPSLAMAVILLALGKPLLWLFGPDFTQGYPVMFALVVGLLARAAVGPAQGLMVATGHQNITAVVMIAAAVANVVLNLLLVPEFGILGAGIATSAALTLEALTFAFIARRVLARAGTGLAHAKVHGSHVQ